MIICQQKIESLDFYLAHPNQEFLVFDLNHQAPRLIHEAIDRKYKLYQGNSTRKVKENWLQHWTFGTASPTTLKVQLWNGVELFDYTKFDNISLPIPVSEMEKVAEIIDTQYRTSKGRLPLTGCGIINNLIPTSITDINTITRKDGVAQDYSVFLGMAMRGGANSVRIFDKVDYETHIDFHQLYASIMKTKRFPRGVPIVHNGYYECQYGLYIIRGGTVRLKPDGFPLLKSLLGSRMAGADGKWFSAYEELGVISTIDLKILKQNYEIEDLDISDTIEYKYTFNGEQYFKQAVDTIYEGRQNNTGAVKRFYKLLNEYVAGFFERATRNTGWWKGLTPPVLERGKSKLNYKNPIIGIFITSYGRQMLNDLLHRFPHDKVIGYDTDCVFFAGTPDEVPQDVLNLMGDKPGQLHYDGIYTDTIHHASKHYEGYDADSGEFFKKASGISKKGTTIRWNSQTQLYEERTNEKR